MPTSRGRRERSLNRQGSDLSGAREARGRDAAAIMMAAEAEEDDMDEINHENWIHRDKLAKIESEELQQVIRLQRRMTETRSDAGRERSHDSRHGHPASESQNEEHSEPWPHMHETQNDGNDSDEEQKGQWDLRRPEEIATDEGAAEAAAAGFYSNPALRKSSSRIPISAASPGPAVPGTRSRAATDEDDDGRGRRINEPAAADPQPTTPSPDSRPASRGFGTAPNTPAKKTPAKATGSGARKTSAPPNNRKTSTARSRAVSNNNTQRPSTRSGESRPTTAVNRPEGDPPWLATMYKPDPRLPPDQQILPTVAKKLQQEQWEKEGRAPTTYDRNFAPLAVHPDDIPPVPVKKDEPEEERPELIEPPPKARTPEPPRPDTRTGYSTMPKLQDTPPMGLTHNPNWTPPTVTAQEKPKKEKGCGCCVVM